MLAYRLQRVGHLAELKPSDHIDTLGKKFDQLTAISLGAKTTRLRESDRH